jgi:hypothetical protein
MVNRTIIKLVTVTVLAMAVAIAGVVQIPAGGGTGTANKTGVFASGATSVVITHNLGVANVDSAVPYCTTGTTTKTTINPANITMSNITSTTVQLNFPAAAAAGNCALNLSGINGNPGSTGATGAAGVDGTPGAKWFVGSGAPSSGTGVNGDFYLNSVNGDVYGPKAAGAWPGSAASNIKGANGVGSAWYNGIGAPSAGLGVNGDFYLANNGDVYGPKNTTWGSVTQNLKGPTGTTGAAGSNGTNGTNGLDAAGCAITMAGSQRTITSAGSCSSGSGTHNISLVANVVCKDGSNNSSDVPWSESSGTVIISSFTGTCNIIGSGTGTIGSGSGDASTNTSTSVDSEVALFSGTGGKTFKRATGTGFAKLTSGVLSAASITASDIPSALSSTTSVNGTTIPNAVTLVQTSRTLTAGTGITGGGDLSADRTFALDTTYLNANYAPLGSDSSFTGIPTFNPTSSKGPIILTPWISAPSAPVAGTFGSDSTGQPAMYDGSAWHYSPTAATRLTGSGSLYLSSGYIVKGATPASKDLVLFDPVTGDSGRIQFKFPYAVTITKVTCNVKASTSATINLDKRAEGTPDTTGTSVLTSGLACITTGASTTTFSSASVAADTPVALTISAVSGTPDTLRVHVYYTY